MAFVRFTEVNKSFVARVSISPRGMLNFTDGARKRYNLDSYDFCVLYYDKDAQIIGVELTGDEQAEGAIKIRKRLTGADLGIKNFLDFFGIVPKKTSMYEIEQGETESWINIKLNTARERKEGKKDESDENE